MKKAILLIIISVFIFLSCSTSNYHLIPVEDFVMQDNYLVSNYFTCDDSICYNSGVFCNLPLDVVFDKVDIKGRELTVKGFVRDDSTDDRIPYCSIKNGEFNTNRDSIKLYEEIFLTDTNGRFEFKVKLIDKACIIFYSQAGYFAKIYELRKNNNKYSQQKYDTIVFYDVKIINQDFLSIIDSFLVHEEENVTYYTDSMSLIINFGYVQDSKLVIFEIKSFPIEFFIEKEEYAYYKYKNHIIYLTENIDNPLNECLFTKSNKHKKILKHFEDKEKTERLKFMDENKDYIWEEDGGTEFENTLRMHTSWFYIYKNGNFIESIKSCPCCSYSSDCNIKNFK